VGTLLEVVEESALELNEKVETTDVEDGWGESWKSNVNKKTIGYDKNFCTSTFF
jgi:hypothetical protein